jgi:hypothetical protein
LLREAAQLFDEGRYEDALAPLREAPKLLNQAREAFGAATQAAQRRRMEEDERGKTTLENEVQALLDSTQKILDAVSRTRKEAGEADAAGLAPEAFREAEAWQRKGMEWLRDGKQQIRRGQYPDAKTTLVEAESTLRRAESGFQEAREKAVEIARDR